MMESGGKLWRDCEQWTAVESGNIVKESDRDCGEWLRLWIKVESSENGGMVDGWWKGERE